MAHAHAGEERAALRDVADAAACVLRGRTGRDVGARQIDRARGRGNDADDRLQQRRLAGAVASKQRDDLVFVHGERCVAHDVALAVERVDVAQCQELRRARPLGMAARLGRERGDAGADVDLLHRLALPRVRGGAVDQHAPVVHHRHAIGQREHPVDVVLDQQHRDVRRDALDQVRDALAFGRREPGERFVEQQHARAGRERQSHVEEPLPAV